MTTQNWPDPKRKGYPLNHKVSAWHLLRTGSGIDTPFYWDAIKIRWKSIGGDWFTPAMIMDICKYQGATFTPAQINKMLTAERDRIKSMVRRACNLGNIITPRQRDMIIAGVDSEITIRNLGAAP